MPDNRIPVGSLGVRDFNDIPKKTPDVQEKPEKKVEKVATGKVTTRAKSAGKKWIDSYFEEDIEVVKKRIWQDVIFPKIQDALVTAFEILVYRGDSAPSRKGTTRNGGGVNYGSYYSGGTKSEPKRSTSPVTRRSNDLDDFIFDTRSDAEDVLTQLVELTDVYGQATVADLMELAGVTGSFTDNNYGWTDLSSARVKRVRDGYLLDLPRPYLLD
jgi:hypothetical protein